MTDDENIAALRAESPGVMPRRGCQRAGPPLGRWLRSSTTWLLARLYGLDASALLLGVGPAKSTSLLLTGYRADHARAVSVSQGVCKMTFLRFFHGREIPGGSGRCQ